MGTPTTPAAVKLIVGVLAASDALLDDSRRHLAQSFGPIDACSTPTAWAVSEYYREEMGDSLLRQYFGFEHLIGPGKLAAVKQMSNSMEDTWRVAGRRQVNLDPGYVASTKLVLASTKDAAHRIYLSGGIYAEVTLFFTHGSFRPHAHTYPDYGAREALAFFNMVRGKYLQQLRGTPPVIH